jgi:hypothetical protein
VQGSSIVAEISGKINLEFVGLTSIESAGDGERLGVRFAGFLV